MNRRFLRSFLGFNPFFNDPFFHTFNHPLRVKVYRTPEVKPVDQANDIFNDFFTQNGIKQEEKAFFEKHYPEKVEKKFDPYSILKVKKDATLDQIKQAYREQALKCHPKIDSTPQAEKQFNDLAKAYDALSNQKYYPNQEQPVSANSFFNDFHKGIDELYTPSKENDIKEGEEKTNDRLKGAQLYSESTYMQNINGKKKVNIEKQYKKDGKILKLKRQESFKQDGSKEVTQTFDDGKEVKKKSFVQKVEQKQLGN